MSRVWAVCSGNGGTGKTTVAVSLAVAAAKSGKKVILLDAAGETHACDLLLGLEHAMTLDLVDVLSQQVNLDAALYRVPRYENLRLACSALHADVGPSEFSGVILALQTLCDVLVLDLPTGEMLLGADVLHDGDARVLLTRADDVSLRSCENMLRRIWNEEGETHLILNRCRKDFVKRGVQYAAETVSMMLDCAVLGAIPEDDSIPLGAIRGRAAIECDGPAWECLKNIATKLIKAIRSP